MNEQQAIERYNAAKVGHWVSLSQYLGVQVTDLIGSIVDYDGAGTPIFKIFKVVFEGESALFVEGEHDCPYIPSDEDVPGLEQSAMMAIVEADN